MGGVGGVWGVLDPELERGDVVLAEEVCGEGGRRYAIDVKLAAETGGGPGRRVRSGRLLTVDRVIRTAAEKAALRERFRADVLDMETAAVAAVCAERGVRLLSVRVISDDARTDLPPEVLTIMGPSGSFRLGAALGAIWRRPGSVKELWAMREQAIEASDRLAKVLPGLIARLP